MKRHRIYSKNKLPLFLRLIDSTSEESIMMEENNDTKNFFHSVAIELESLFNKKKPGFKNVQNFFEIESSILYYGLDPLKTCFILNNINLEEFFLEIQKTVQLFEPRFLSINPVQVVDENPYVKETTIVLEAFILHSGKKQKIMCEVILNMQLMNFKVIGVYPSDE
jgi:predicted component of type VI protein secretion system